MIKKMNEEQMQKLFPFEGHFGKAIRAKWAPYPGRDNLIMMNNIYTEVTGVSRHLSPSCDTCIVNLLRDLGKIYFERKAELEQENEQKQAALEQEHVELEQMAANLEQPAKPARKPRTRKAK